MIKIIIGCCALVVLSGLGVYFCLQSDDTITDDTIKTEESISEVSLNIKDTPDKIIEVDYENEENRKITKCSVDGCV